MSASDEPCLCATGFTCMAREHTHCQECQRALMPHDEFVCSDCAIILSAADDATWD